jgi:hypothetical protein
VYFNIGIPPVDVGAVNDTVTELVDVLVTAVIVGAPSGIGLKITPGPTFTTIIQFRLEE